MDLRSATRAYLSELDEIGKGARSWLDQMNKGATQLDPAIGVCLYELYQKVGRDVLVMEIPGVSVPPCGTPTVGEYLRREDLLELLHQVDRLSLALRAVLSLGPPNEADLAWSNL
jgi:hypothetical protein